MKIKLDGQAMKTAAKNFFLVAFGTVVLAFGTAIFIIPMKIISGGMSGFALVLESVLPSGLISIDLLITVMTWGLFFVGLIVLGKDFALKTLVSSIIYPVAISLFLHLSESHILDGFFRISESEYGELSLLISAIIGGVIVGAGCALTFLGGGSTGGVDIIAFALCKFFKRLKSSVVIFIVDAAPIVIGMFINGDMIMSIVGIFSALAAALVIDKIFLGGTAAFVAYVVTNDHALLSSAVIEKLGRTTTVLDAVGGYTGDARKLVMISFSRTQYAELMNIINTVDEGAFVSIHQAHQINGEGWTR